MPSSQIVAIGVAIPSLHLPVDVLAKHLGTDPDKYRIGLGCRAQSLCSSEESPVTLGIRAAQDAIEQWGGSRDRIGMLAVATECALDMTRPMGAWMTDALQLPQTMRSYEVKHACYAGTAGLRQAYEWQRSGAARGKAALVICTDQALYAPGHPGEPTQGAAAVAIILDQEGFADIGLASYPFQRPAFDFWRPVGEAYPRVDGPLSVQCYKDAFGACLAQWHADHDAPFRPEQTDVWAMHAPFPKMVKKGFLAGQMAAGLSEEQATRDFEQRVLPSLAWNRRTGNCYTASTWLSFVHAVTHATSSQNIGVFSYGSGCGAELLTIQQHTPLSPRIAQAVEAQFDAQKRLSADAYHRLRHPTSDSMRQTG